VSNLTPFSLPPQLDAVLAQRGYGVIDQTLVMHLDIQQAPIQGTPQKGDITLIPHYTWPKTVLAHGSTLRTGRGSRLGLDRR
jgi:hypothetical protein